MPAILSEMVVEAYEVLTHKMFETIETLFVAGNFDACN